MSNNQNIKNVNISVLGAGSWGGTLTWLFSNKGYKVNLWTPIVEEFNQIKTNKKLIRPIKISLNKNVNVTCDLSIALKNCNVLVFAVPANYFETTVKKVKEAKIKKEIILLSATKGITKNKTNRPSQILKRYFPKNNYAVLSGPNIALDILLKSPVISVIAANNINTAKVLQKIISTDYFRIYINNDITGVEIAGALKNVIALGAGMSDGFGFNISTKASLISRGLIEIGRIMVKEGAKLKTLLSAAAIGDLIATSCSRNSRNYKVGYELSKGKKLDQILKNLGQVAEGVETVKTAYILSKKHKIYTPIINAVHNIIIKRKKPKDELKKLLSIPLKEEINF